MRLNTFMCNENVYICVLPAAMAFIPVFNLFFENILKSPRRGYIYMYMIKMFKYM